MLGGLEWMVFLGTETSVCVLTWPETFKNAASQVDAIERARNQNVGVLPQSPDLPNPSHTEVDAFDPARHLTRSFKT